jgi:hypothetical protein
MLEVTGTVHTGITTNSAMWYILANSNIANCHAASWNVKL